MKQIFIISVVYLASAYALDESRIKNSDCSSQNAQCIEEKCRCGPLSYSNETYCLAYATEFTALCYEDNQCEWIGDNSECRNNRCLCKDGYRWFKGKCQSYVDKGEDCSSNDECYNGYDLLSLNCSGGKCKCNTDYYERGAGDCRVSSSVGKDCALDLDCKPKKTILGTIYSTCILGTCVKTDTSISNKDYTNFEIFEESTISDDSLKCYDDADCDDIGSICVDSQCQCPSNYFHFNNSCVQGFSECNTDEDCAYNNTMCFKNTTCVCRPGFFVQTGKCVAELGMPDAHASYAVDSDCPIKPGKAKGDACYCKDYWFNDESNRKCIKTTIEQTKACLTNDWCRAMGPYAFCNTNTKQCECNSFAQFNETLFYCQLINSTAGVCIKDTECKINERCINENCDCKLNFTKDNGTCIPNIGASCRVESCSHIENSVCIAGVCNCEQGYISLLSKSRCLKIADNLTDECEMNEQCKNIPNSVCDVSDSDPDAAGDRKTCICDENYTAIENNCYQIKKYGDICSTKLNCTLVLNESFQCRNSICQCAVGQKLKNGYCTSGGNKWTIEKLTFCALMISWFVFKF